MLPFLISKTKLLPMRKETKLKEKQTKEIQKEKSFFITGDNLATFKSFRLKRRPSKLPSFTTCDCNLMHLTKLVIKYAPRSRKRGASESSHMVLSMTALGTTGQRKRMKLPSVHLPRKSKKKDKPLSYNSDQFFKKLEVGNKN